MMKRRLRKAGRKLRARKPAAALRALTTPHHSETRVLDARKAVGAFLGSHHNNTVAYGPFAGLKLPRRPYWGGQDVAAKILGTYEAHVAALMAEAADAGNDLIDLGAADGYFAIGALKAGFFRRAFAYEASAKGQRALEENARLNGVEDRLTIRGTATTTGLLGDFPDSPRGVCLCDIEGGEFALFDAGLLDHLKCMLIVIELHDPLVPNGSDERRALLERARQTHSVDLLRATSPDVFAFRELDGFGDDHRLLALSEGRDSAMDWAVLRPKPEARDA